MKIVQFPLAKVTMCFLVGIVVAYTLEPNVYWVFSLLFLANILVGVTYFISKKNRIYNFYFGISVLILSFNIGTTAQIIHIDTLKKNHYSKNGKIFESPHLISGFVREKLRSTLLFDRYIFLVNEIDNQPVSGRLLLHIRKAKLLNSLEIGTHIQIKGTLNANKSVRNPNGFDYGKYLENKQIYAQIYTNVSELKEGSIIFKDSWFYASKIRNRIVRNLKKNNFNSTELNIAFALILGQQQDISPEIIKDYQYAGAVHILSVSGLHIGFILLFVTFILTPFPNTQFGLFIKLIIVLISLFSFGFIAGLAPSVLRSVVMFSFVAIGIYLRRSTAIFHTLLVSMLLILLIQPSFLFDVGFQLSYLALFFILWVQPIVTNLWKPKTKITNYFWEILTVSFAAQIGTLPLSIYYFHQFPGLFFITNLIVIPFLSFIMALGVLVMVLAIFDFIPLFIIQLLEKSIYILNLIISKIASFDQFVFREIPFNWQMMISLYLLIITTIIWFQKPNFKKLIFILTGIFLIQVVFFYSQYKIKNQHELVIFQYQKNTLLIERIGSRITLFGDDSVLKTANKNILLSTYSTANFSSLKVKKRIENLLYFKGKKILIVDSLGIYPRNISPNIVLMRQSPKINFDRFLKITKPSIVIADGSCFKNIQELWKESCFKNKIPFHSINEKGFYKVE